MRKGILVGTWSGGKDFANLCLNSLEPVRRDFPIIVGINDFHNADSDWVESLRHKYDIMEIYRDGYELAPIFGMANIPQIDIDEFWFFQDTIEITDCSFIPLSLQQDGLSFSYCKQYMIFYLGKYRTETLKKMMAVEVRSKKDSMFWEWYFTRLYHYIDYDGRNSYVVDPELNIWDKDNNYIDTIFGEERLIIKGKYLIKRLGLTDFNIPNLLKDTDESFEVWKNTFSGGR